MPRISQFSSDLKSPQPTISQKLNDYQADDVESEAGSEILDGFISFEKLDIYLSGECFLKTKTDRFKEHWAVLSGNEIFCYRERTEKQFRVMHSLSGTFVKDQPAEKDPDSDKLFFPVKIVLPPGKSRILYFDCMEVQ